MQYNNYIILITIRMVFILFFSVITETLYNAIFKYLHAF